MAGGAGIMLKGNASKPVNAVAAERSFAVGSNALLAALKEELFAVETDRLQGRLSETEYAEQKSALETVLRRALLRGEHGANASNVTGPVV